MDEPTCKSKLTVSLSCLTNDVFKVSEVDHCLLRNLMAVCPEQQKLKVNLHQSIPLLIREADLMIKMDLPVPVVALTLYSKQERFSLVQDSLQVRK